MKYDNLRQNVQPEFPLGDCRLNQNKKVDNQFFGFPSYAAWGLIGPASCRPNIKPPGNGQH